MVVQWVRYFAPFQVLPESDLRLLLEETWTQLFLLHLAQLSTTWDISGFLADEQICRRLPDNESRVELEIIRVNKNYFMYLQSETRKFTKNM